MSDPKTLKEKLERLRPGLENGNSAAEDALVEMLPDLIVTLQELDDIKVFWRAEARAAYFSAACRYMGAVEFGELKLASDLMANRLRPLGAAIEADVAGDRFEKCLDCGKRLVEGEPVASYDDESGSICLACSNLESSPYVHHEYDHEEAYQLAKRSLEEFKPKAEQAYEAAYGGDGT